MSDYRETFEAPEIEVIELDKADVIATSGCAATGMAPMPDETEPLGS